MSKYQLFPNPPNLAKGLNFILISTYLNNANFYTYQRNYTWQKT